MICCDKVNGLNPGVSVVCLVCSQGESSLEKVGVESSATNNSER